MRNYHNRVQMSYWGKKDVNVTVVKLTHVSCLQAKVTVKEIKRDKFRTKMWSM